MITVTITNLSSAHSIGYGTDYPLPGAFAWATIAASGNKAYVTSVDDLEACPGNNSGGLKVKDLLQQMVQAGYITVGSANISVDNEVYGAAIAAET